MRPLGLILPIALLLACSSKSEDPPATKAVKADPAPAQATQIEAADSSAEASSKSTGSDAGSGEEKPGADEKKADEAPRPTEPPACAELLTSEQLAVACPVAELELREYPNPKAEGYYCMLKAHTDQKAGDYVSVLATAAPPSATDSEALKVKSSEFKPKGKTQLVSFIQGGTHYTLQELANSGSLVCDPAKLATVMEAMRPRVP